MLFKVGSRSQPLLEQSSYMQVSSSSDGPSSAFHKSLRTLLISAHRWSASSSVISMCPEGNGNEIGQLKE